MERRNTKGFTLVELSIVLIIIGLLIAGVTAGSKLIDQAKLRKLVSEFRDYESAYNTFKTTYDAIPGDYNDATNTISGVGSTCGDSDTSDESCNGNGNGIIAVGDEQFKAWHHMIKAGIVNVYLSLSGRSNHASERDTGTPGTNIPASNVKTTAGYSLIGSANAAVGKVAASLILGTAKTGEPAQAASLSGSDAKNIDGKLDDGKPMTGRFIAFPLKTIDPISLSYDGTNCFDNAAGANKYQNSTTVGCTVALGLDY